MTIFVRYCRFGALARTLLHVPEPVLDLILSVFGRVYDVWAKYRLQITGRPDLATIMEQKKTCR